MVSQPRFPLLFLVVMTLLFPVFLTGCATEESEPLLFVQAVCVADSYQCNGPHVERCESDGSRWTYIETCPMACSNGGCNTVATGVEEARVPESAFNTCAGNCGQFRPEANCQCHEACFATNTCCSDICTTCNAAFVGECAGICIPDCIGKPCGDDGCGGSCGTCADGLICNYDHQCILEGCTGECTGKACGDDGCGELCGSCAAGEFCDDGTCVVGSCTPDCTGKNCGDDGCGDLCGQCSNGQTCENGQCKAGPCVPNCAGLECGTDGCGGVCGTCSGNQTCQSGTCEEIECTPNCTGKSCGDNGCGDVCGECTGNQTCQGGTCVEAGCTPNCNEKTCGDDGCGDVCGECSGNQTCQGGTCENTPCVGNCEGKTCGDDGCGSSCGECVWYADCTDNMCVSVNPIGETVGCTNGWCFLSPRPSGHDMKELWVKDADNITGVTEKCGLRLWEYDAGIWEGEVLYWNDDAGADLAGTIIDPEYSFVMQQGGHKPMLMVDRVPMKIEGNTVKLLGPPNPYDDAYDDWSGRDIYALSANEYLMAAASSGGEFPIQRYKNGSWSLENTPDDLDCYGLWGVGSNHLHAYCNEDGTDNQVYLRFTGSSWSPLSVPMDNPQFKGLLLDGSAVFLTEYSDQIRIHTNGSWKTINMPSNPGSQSLGATIGCITGASKNDFYFRVYHSSNEKDYWHHKNGVNSLVIDDEFDACPSITLDENTSIGKGSYNSFVTDWSFIDVSSGETTPFIGMTLTLSGETLNPKNPESIAFGPNGELMVQFWSSAPSVYSGGDLITEDWTNYGATWANGGIVSVDAECGLGSKKTIHVDNNGVVLVGTYAGGVGACSDNECSWDQLMLDENGECPESSGGKSPYSVKKIQATSASERYALADALYRWNGSMWTEVSLGFEPLGLSAPWGGPAYVGGAEQIVKINGTSVTPLPALPPPPNDGVFGEFVTGLWAVNGTTVFIIVGKTLFKNTGGSSWTEVSTPFPVIRVGGSSATHYAVMNDDGDVAVRKGNSWDVTPCLAYGGGKILGHPQGGLAILSGDTLVVQP